ncbi:MAG: thiamine-phosphate kinase [Elusimicrobiota bacterium]
MKLKNYGEYNLINKILGWLSADSLYKKRVIVAPGDDAAVINSPDKQLVFTTDLLFEDAHFCLSWADSLISRPALFEALGYKSLAINLSDLSSMGCKSEPIYCLIGVGLPDSRVEIEDINSFYKGLKKFCKKYKVFILGGDTNSSDKLTIAITMFGATGTNGKIIRRSGAKPGDKIYVTGPLGDSAGGLDILLKGKKTDKKTADYLIKKHLYPPVRINEAQTIAKYATSMIDCSDGLANSIGLICAMSKTGAKINLDTIPVSGPLKRYSGSPIDFALYGGEDYELIFTSKKSMPKYRCIGTVENKNSGIKYYQNGKEIQIKKEKLYQHFK